MAKVVRIFIFVAVAVLVAVTARNYFPLLRERFFAVLPGPCRFPLTYRLDSFDPNFGISQEGFVAAMKQAADLWNKPLGKVVLAYQENGAVAVNLVFDQRQAQAVRLQRLLQGINSDKGKYAALETEYASLRTSLTAKEADYNKRLAEYKNKESQYNALVVSYNAAIVDYNNTVDQWNAQGGAPPAEYNTLQQEKQQNQATYQEIQTMEADLSATVQDLRPRQDDINALVAQINELAGIMNNSAAEGQPKVAAYNAGLRGETDIGEYVEDASGRRIDVYQFLDRKELVEILAHEMGHAMELAHVSTTDAIMYAKFGAQHMALTPADIAEFNRLCGGK